ncbi:DUF5054 domain-containing protein [Martelella soudanensis]|uniref:DUF5054 domain-containing protein n=1 Tax=unclassified Martelella TaxID=2629616 RepID=UPI0015DE70AD|nr:MULTISPECIES: DUF5054 domain-containing protein [unclassified Martelella]
MRQPTIHLVFKTHLDIGFTDHAEKVRRQYHEVFIPQALTTAEHFHRENPNRPAFVWTTGAWLIWDHLETRPAAEAERLERAITNGLIRWHGLPFTTHSELMSPALFRAGLSYSQMLDARFGLETRAAKMTDVPGHTLGIVPLMAAAGLRFLHIGVNTASPVPAFPPLCRWRAPDGSEIVVMYEATYGGVQFPEGLSDGLGFAHTQDNIGPQTVSQTAEIYRALRHAHPDADIRAATLETYGEILWARKETLPVVEIEPGDSWIHGAAADPVKIARFRSLQRLYDAFEADGLNDARKGFGRDLAMLAEHTCGVDIKTYLRDEKAWDRPAFEEARRNDYRFAYSEASWAEQRGYIDMAAANLTGEDRIRADNALAQTEPPRRQSAPALVQADGFSLGEWSCGLDPRTGDIIRLTAPDGRAFAGDALIGYRHESYDAGDVAAHMDSYLTHREEWAILDHDKPGLLRAKTARSAVFAPRFLGIEHAGETVVIHQDMPPEAHRDLGAPKSIELHLSSESGKLRLALVLREKRANRMPEAGFLSFAGSQFSRWTFLKTGLWHEAGRTAVNGGGQLQAIFAAQCRPASGPGLEIVPLDTPLVAPHGQPFMPYAKEPAAYDSGIRFNLYNNKWGTNFPMWWEGDMQARFHLSVTGKA